MYDEAIIIRPATKVIILPMVTSFVIFPNLILKSCAIFELIAQSKESAVEVKAATSAQIANTKISGLVKNANEGRSGLAPAGNARLRILVCIPK